VKSRYLVKIIPPFGYRIYRLQFSRRHVVLLVALVALLAAASAWLYVSRIGHAEARALALRSLTSDQHDRLMRIDQQAGDLDSQLRALEQQNEELRKMIGAGPAPAGAARPARRAPARAIARVTTDDFGLVAARIADLRTHSANVRAEGERLRSLTLRVLNMKRLEALSRAAMLAEIPSISPTGHPDVASTFGWRLTPWPEFHQGLDLAGDSGQPVRAAAAGRVVFAAYDPGGYGNRVEIDHGNGYHTWYCHLSKIDVPLGAHVRKAEHIAEIGSTGESTGPHLHYQVMLDGKAIDPQPYISGVPARVLAALK